MTRKLTAKGEGKMGLTRVQVTLKRPGSLKPRFTSDFLVDTGATDSMAPASKLRAIGIQPIGERAYELADGTEQRYEYGLVEIKFMNEITAGRVIFGPENVEPILGVTAGISRHYCWSCARDLAQAPSNSAQVTEPVTFQTFYRCCC